MKKGQQMTDEKEVDRWFGPDQYGERLDDGDVAHRRQDQTV